MSRTQWIIAGAMVLAAVLSVLLFLGPWPGGRGDGRQSVHVHGVPQPGVQQETSGDEEPPAIELTADQQRLIGARSVPARMTSMKKTIRAAARIEYDEQLLFTVNAKVDGWIELLHADYTGRYLKKGEPLMEIYSPELLAAQQELISLSRWEGSGGASFGDAMIAEDTRRLLESARQRLRLWDITDAQIERVQRTGTAERTLTIASPVSGHVVRRFVTKGMRVMVGEPLLDVAGLSRVWVIGEVSEADAGLVRQGMPARISVSGLAGSAFSAAVDFIYPVLDAQTRTLRLRCTLENPDLMIKPQMFATVELHVDLGTRLAVPEDAVMDTGERNIVYVDRGEGTFEPRLVTAGIRADGMREIVSGVREGEPVAASALFLIDSEAQLRGVAPVAP